MGVSSLVYVARVSFLVGFLSANLTVALHPTGILLLCLVLAGLGHTSKTLLPKSPIAEGLMAIDSPYALELSERFEEAINECTFFFSTCSLGREPSMKGNPNSLESLATLLLAFNLASNLHTGAPTTILPTSHVTITSMKESVVEPIAATASQDSTAIHVMCEWEDGWLIWKPSGVAVHGVRPNRSGMTLQQWIRKNLRIEGDILAPVGTTEAGIIVLAKSHVKKGMLGEAACKVQCVWELLVKGSPPLKVAPEGLQILDCRPSKTFHRICKIRVEADARLTTETICSALELMGSPLIGSTSAKAPGVRGLQLALIEASIPVALLSRDSSACHAVQEVPKKFEKLMRREALFHDRQKNLALNGNRTEVIEFRGLKLMVAPGLLRPRESSACLVDAALAHLQTSSIPLPPRILDLGCGSGALALAATLDMPSEAANMGIDIDEEAISFARQNAADLGLPPGGKSLEFHVADFTKLHVDREIYKEAFAVIVSNPPFFSLKQISQRVSDETDSALSSGKSGFEFYDAICLSVVSCDPPILRPGGKLIFQLPFGPQAQQAVAEIAAKHGARVREYIIDQRGVERGVALQWD